MKILCLCAGGNTRSVTPATRLKYSFGGHDALAASIEKNDPDTLRMLMTWADKILVVDTEILGEVVESYRDEGRGKTMLIPIGKDRWGMSMHPELVPIAYRLLTDAGFTAKRTAEEISARLQKYIARRQATAPEA